MSMSKHDWQYLNTRALSKRYGWSPRTIFRKMKRAYNPMPQPVIKTVGSSNLWLLEDIKKWDASEMRRSKEEDRLKKLQSKVNFSIN